MVPDKSSCECESGTSSETAGSTTSEDNQFYTVSGVHYTDVADHLQVNDAANLKLAVGPCRVGTKAQLFTMAASGYPAYDQPLKAIFRCLGRGLEPEEITFPQGVTYLKETLGPYTQFESDFNPWEIFGTLRSDSWLSENLKVVLMLRNPVDTWFSWVDLWEGLVEYETLLTNFVRAYQTMRELRENLTRTGVPHVVFDYSRNKTPGPSYRNLFSFLGLRNEPIYEGWKEDEVRRRINRHWRSFKEPEVFLPEGIREDVKSSNGVYYQSSDKSRADVPDTVQTEVLPLYEDLIS